MVAEKSNGITIPYRNRKILWSQQVAPIFGAIVTFLWTHFSDPCISYSFQLMLGVLNTEKPPFNAVCAYVLCLCHTGKPETDVR